MSCSTEQGPGTWGSACTRCIITSRWRKTAFLCKHVFHSSKFGQLWTAVCTNTYCISCIFQIYRFRSLKWCNALCAQLFGFTIRTVYSVSSRISKGQGYQGFLRKRAGSSFGKKGQFASYKEKLEKWTEFTTFRVNKMFPISFNTFKTLWVAPWWSWYHKFPLGRKRAQGRPLVSEGRGALLKMPRRNTSVNSTKFYRLGEWRLKNIAKDAALCAVNLFSQWRPTVTHSVSGGQLSRTMRCMRYRGNFLSEVTVLYFSTSSKARTAVFYTFDFTSVQFLLVDLKYRNSNVPPSTV
jgi:hypothetical protein